MYTTPLVTRTRMAPMTHIIRIFLGKVHRGIRKIRVTPKRLTEEIRAIRVTPKRLTEEIRAIRVTPKRPTEEIRAIRVSTTVAHRADRHSPLLQKMR